MIDEFTLAEQFAPLKVFKKMPTMKKHYNSWHQLALKVARKFPSIIIARRHLALSTLQINPCVCRPLAALAPDWLFDYAGTFCSQIFQKILEKCGLKLK